MFTPPADNAQTAFEDMPFWRWLANQGKASLRESYETDLGAVVAYLRTCGFAEGRDVVEPDLLDVLLVTYKHFWSAAPEIKPRKLADVFCASAGGFFVAGLVANQRYSVAPEVLQALQTAGWIYEAQPGNTYFQIVNGRVWAKYQSILGQRCLFEITE